MQPAKEEVLNYASVLSHQEEISVTLLKTISRALMCVIVLKKKNQQNKRISVFVMQQNMAFVQRDD